MQRGTYTTHYLHLHLHSTCMLYVIFVRRPLELTIADRGKILRKRPTMQNIRAMTEKVRFQAPNLPVHILYVCPNIWEGEVHKEGEMVPVPTPLDWMVPMPIPDPSPHRQP